MTIQLIIAVIGLVGTLLGLWVNWYADQKRKDEKEKKRLLAEQQAYEKKVETWADQQTEVNEQILKQSEAENQWKSPSNK